MTAQPSHETPLRELYRSLDERWRAEEVAQKVLGLLELTSAERRTLEKAAQAGRQNFWSSMSGDFQRPQGHGPPVGRG